MDHLTPAPQRAGSYWKLLLPYALVYFFVSLSDAVMSYATPVYIEHHLKNPALMGLIISSSSVVGIVCDFIFSKIFKNKSFIFFIWSAVISAAIFPGLFRLFPPGTGLFLIGMAIWGIYYELLIFSDFNFIKQSLSQNTYSAGWGILNSFKAAAYFLGPLLAVYLTATGFRPAFLSAIGFTVVSGFILFVFSFRLTLKKTDHHPPDYRQTQNKSATAWVAQFKIWLILIRKIWPVYIFIIIIYLIDSAFWTVGTLVSEQLRESGPVGGLFLPAYSLPTLFVGLVVGRIFPSTGKKHLAFITAAIAGILLSLVGFTTAPISLIGIVFCSSLLLSVTFPEIYAVFEDYVTRLGDFGNDMVGLQSSATSLAYIIGPVMAGSISAWLGYRLTFTFFGLLLTGYSLFALVITPKKIRLPQQQLQNST